ncbi:MAG TPA: hypothetical protein VGN38_01990 [Caulobacteraceae bacterium]|nr:hypothetical protein [Caulobacteraceae bacterium]
MGAARHLAPKWVDTDLPWDEPAKAEDTPLLAVVDRFHNHEEMSPEGMAEAIADLQAAVESLDGRLAGAVSEASQATKGLGASMVQMGDALTKRVRELEESAQSEAERASKQIKALQAANKRNRRIGLALAGVLAVGIAGTLVLRFQAPASKPAAPAQVLYSPDQPAPNP